MKAVLATLIMWLGIVSADAFYHGAGAPVLPALSQRYWFNGAPYNGLGRGGTQRYWLNGAPMGFIR